MNPADRTPRPSEPPGLAPAAGLPAEMGLPQFRDTAAGRSAWLWHGYLAPGYLTLLTSRWKSGKTTLLSMLLARLKTGGSFLGLPPPAGKAVVVSEAGPAHVARPRVANHLLPSSGKTLSSTRIRLTSRRGAIILPRKLLLFSLLPRFAAEGVAP